MKLDELKAKLPMPVLVTRLGIDLDRRGMCKCPFHDDKTPSFGIYNKGKWRFKCFSNGCRASKGGDEKDLIELHFVCSSSDAHRKYEDMVCRG